MTLITGMDGLREPVGALSTCALCEIRIHTCAAMPEAGQIAAGVGPEPAEPAEPAEPEGLAGPHASASSTSSTSAQACSRACATKSWLEANNLRDSQGCVALVSDEALLLHAGPTNHPERPARLAEILKQLDLSGLQSACTKVASREATKEELLRVHTENHIERVSKSSSAKKKGKDWGLLLGSLASLFRSFILSFCLSFLFPTLGVGLLDFKLNSSPLFSSPGLLLAHPWSAQPQSVAWSAQL